MKQGNVIQEKSYAYAARIVKLYRFMIEQNQEYVLSKQLVRSGTSIGANVEEGIGGQSEKDFLAKINIAYKEARETHFWLRLLRDTDYLTDKQANSMIEDCDELLKIMGSIIKTVKTKLKS